MTPYRVAYIGSRGYPRFDVVADSLFRLAAWSGRTGRPVVVVSGTTPPGLGARRRRPDGVDEFALRVGGWLGLGTRAHDPDYAAYPPAQRWRAPLDRNPRVVDDCDDLAAFWDLRSRGTARTLAYALRAGKVARCYGPGGEPIAAEMIGEAVRNAIGQ